MATLPIKESNNIHLLQADRCCDLWPTALKRLLLAFLFSFFFLPISFAQQIHPVTAAVQLVPPYSVYLLDYAAPGSDKLRIILTLNDITQPSYRVKLALKVELNGRLIMQTDPTFQPQPLDLLPGQPVIISGAALANYLTPAHLQFLGGFSRESYERTKALPEGAYRICFTAYDYNRPDRVQLSNEGCNMFFFKKSEPPVLNLPFHRSRVDGKTPQFLTFSWSDRNTPSMQGGSWSRPSYRFELFEVRPAGSNPEYIVRSSKPIYTTTTEQTNLIYGPAEPRLLDSMQYVWRVQAVDREGRDAYQNNGYSQAYLFTYGGLDPFQVNQIGRPLLTGEALSERSGQWHWSVSNQSKVDGWKLQYRKRGATGGHPSTTFEWNSEETTDTLLSLFNLEADHTYEARVQARVKGLYGPFSEVAVLLTLPQRVFACGQKYDQQSTIDGQPLQAATAGMVVRVGDFDMQLLQVEGSNGFFSGYGAVTTPLLGMRVNVKFTGIGINDKLVMTSGEVVALSEGLPQWVNERLEVDRDVKVIKGWSERMPHFETATLEELQAFARELLSIEEGIWNDTYVYSERERKEVKGYILEVKAAMQELSDNDPSNDAAAGEKLRTSLQAAKPLLQKLSNNIGKGILVKLGLVREKLYKAVIADYIKELKTAATTGFQPFTNADYLAQRGPNFNEVDQILANLPACFTVLDKSQQQALADYLQQKLTYADDWKSYADALQERIKEQPIDESFFAAIEKEIEAAAAQNAGLTVEDWGERNTLKWSEANERLCHYVIEEFKAAASGITLSENTVFLTPTGHIITLPKGAIVHGSCTINGNYGYDGLIEFTVEGKRYKASGSKEGVIEFRQPFAMNSYRYQGETYPTAKWKSIQVSQSKEVHLIRVFGVEGTYTLSLVKQALTKPLHDNGGSYAGEFTDALPEKAGQEQKMAELDITSACRYTPTAPPQPKEKSIFDDIKVTELQGWLKEQASKAEIYLSDCETDNVVKVTAAGTGTTQLTTAQARKLVADKAFKGDYALFVCLGKDGKWQADMNFGKETLNPTHPKLKEQKAALEQEIKKQALDELKSRNANGGKDPEATDKAIPASSDPADGEFYKQKLNIVKALSAIYDFGKHIVNEAKLPEGTWNKQEKGEEYQKSPFHVPPLLAGGGDAVIDEVTEGVQFVQLAYTVVRKPKETVNGLWNAVKKVKPSDIRKLIITDEAIANYQKGGNMSRHQGGKDGVRVAMTILTVWKSAGKSGKEILEKGGDEIDELKDFFAKEGEDFDVLFNARKVAGNASGNGVEITGNWLRGTEKNAGLFPKSIADKMKGKTYNNFDEFRQDFWKNVADDATLSKQFTQDNIYRMKAGAAPRAELSQQLGGQQSYVLHHKKPINQGGAVYDMDNLQIVTPRFHKEILLPEYHYGYGY